MNPTRVQRPVKINGGNYNIKVNTIGRPLNQEYTCLSPQVILNLHYPERWGYVSFANDFTENLNFLNPVLEEYKLMIWKYFYVEQDLGIE